jgi:hypothetical protein
MGYAIEAKNMLRTCKIIVILIMLLAGLFVLSGTTSATPAGYLYNVDHAITASSDGALPCAVMELLVYNTSGTNGNNVLYVGSNCRSDFNDIWINDSTDTVTFPHYINWSASDGNHVNIIYNITTGVPLGGTTIKIHYGYSAANNHENATGVYLLYDDFLGVAVNSALWDTSQTPTVNGGILSLNGSANENIFSKASFPNNTVLTFRASYPASTIAPYSQVGYRDVIEQNIACFFTDSSTTYVQTYSASTGSAVAKTWDNTWHIFKIERAGGHALYYIDDVKTDISANVPQSALKILFMEGANNQNIQIDYVYVSMYVAHPPTDGSWGVVAGDILQSTKFTLSSLIGVYSGVQVQVTNINGNNVASGVTGIDGSITFQLYRNTYYHISFIDIESGIDAEWYGYPYDQENTVWIWPPGFFNPFNWFTGVADSVTGYFTDGTPSTPDVTKGVDTAVAFGDLTGGDGYYAAIYNDHSNSTSTVNYSLYVYNFTGLGWYLVNASTIAGSQNNVNFTIDGATNNTYMLNITGTTGIYGNVYRSSQHTFMAQWSMLGFTWPGWFNLYAALFLILGIAMAGTRRYELGVGVAIVVVTFICDMLNLMSSIVTHGQVFIMLTLMVVVIIIYAVAKWRREHGI